jgi:hypothetical protein
MHPLNRQRCTNAYFFLNSNDQATYFSACNSMQYILSSDGHGVRWFCAYKYASTRGYRVHVHAYRVNYWNRYRHICSLIDWLAPINIEFPDVRQAAARSSSFPSPLTATEAQYEAIKLEESAAGGFTARGQAVMGVDEFLYLGVMLWWRWNWKRRVSTRWGRG